MWRTVWAYSSVHINIVSCLCPSETEWTSINGNLIIMFSLVGGVPWLLSIQKSACCPIFKIELHKWKITCPTFKSCVMLKEYSIMRVHLLLVIFLREWRSRLMNSGVSGQSHSQVLLMMIYLCERVYKISNKLAFTAAARATCCLSRMLILKQCLWMFSTTVIGILVVYKCLAYTVQ